jgi:hypothetical protein
MVRSVFVVLAILSFIRSTFCLIRQFIDFINNRKPTTHGPCVSAKDEAVDVAFCFRLHSWPRQAEQWIYRRRPGQWPIDILINEIVNYGCILTTDNY